MSNFFFADKANRNAAFAFPNQDEGLLNRVIEGDQSAHVHPVPAMLGTRQKVGNPLETVVPEDKKDEQAGRM